MMRKSFLRKLGLGTAAAAFAVSHASAQVAEPDDDVYILDAFIVDAQDQRGYVASTSMSGTRLAQLVRDIPIPIDIITEDFIRDTGALSVREALQYTAGLETEITSQQAGENPSPTGTSFRLRGFVSQAVLRHGFRREGTSDTINVTQVDVVRGPNALLYGIGNFGGVVNYVTRMPRDELQFDTRVSVGSWGFYRVQADITGPITENIAVRVPVMYQDRDNWYDNYRESRRAIAPVLSYRISRRTRLQVEFDFYELRGRSPENPLAPGMLAPTVLPFTDPTHYPQSQEDAADDPRGFLVYPSREFRYGGMDNFRDQTDIGVLALLTHAFTDNLALNLGVYWTETKVESQTSAVSLGTIDLFGEERAQRLNRERYPWAYNPLHQRYNEWAVDEFRAIQYNWSRADQERERRQARFELAYQPDWFGLDHSFMAGATYDNLITRTTPFGFKDTAEPAQSLASNDYTGLGNARPRFQSINNLNPIRFDPSPTEGFYQTADAVRGFDAEAFGSYLIHQTSFFDDRLRTILGLRYDRYQISRRSQRYNREESLELAGDESLVGRLKPDVIRQPATSEVNYSLGVSWSPTVDIAIFALTASALDPEVTGGQTTPDGLIPDPQSGQSYEIGAKVDFMDNRISGSFSLYSITRENVVVNAEILNPAPDSVVESDRWEAEGRQSPGQRALREDRSEGFDAQFFFIDFVPNFETIVSFSYNKYTILDAVYLRFEGIVDDQFVFDRVKARQGVEDGIISSLPWLDERLNNDTPKYTFRVWNKYTFREGPLEGFDIGLGVRWTDRREAQFDFFSTSSYKVIPDRVTVDMAFGYSVALWDDRELNLRLNITNLLDDDTVYGYAYTEPRRWRLTASYRF
ncbi:MAG: TonB-dependent receptor plug domain-containing protein [Opitutales bacterium]|nr:TonB-dependent receptor plug domain-containing protein [Opitutales bacterium]